MNKHIGCLNTVVFKFFGVIPLIICLGHVIYCLTNGQFEEMLRVDLTIFFLAGWALCSYKTCLTFDNTNFVITSKIFGVTWKKDLNYVTKLYVKPVSSPNLYAGSGTPDSPSSYSVILQGKFDGVGEEISRFFGTSYHINNKEDSRSFLVRVNELAKLSGLPVSYSEEAKDILRGLI